MMLIIALCAMLITVPLVAIALSLQEIEKLLKKNIKR